MFPASETFTSVYHPNLRYEVKFIGIAGRRRLEGLLAANGLRQRVIQAEYDNLSKLSPETGRIDLLELKDQERIFALEQELHHLIMEERTVLVQNVIGKIEGVSESGEWEPIELNELMEYAPEEIFFEMVRRTKDRLGISEIQAGNSQRPITSQPREDGPTPVTSAEVAGEKETISPETVEPTSQS